MRLEGNTLVVSRRNLLALLAKLDGHPPNSNCMRKAKEFHFSMGGSNQTNVRRAIQALCKI